MRGEKKGRQTPLPRSRQPTGNGVVEKCGNVDKERGTEDKKKKQVKGYQENRKKEITSLKIK